MVRYLQAAQGQIAWGDEATDYTRGGTVTTPFGLINSAIDWPTGNPVTPKATVNGGRRPYLHSRDPYDLKFSIKAELQDMDHFPGQCCIGAGVATSGSGYTGKKWSDDDRLETITVLHEQKDAALQEYFVGCKGDLTLSGSQGSVITAAYDLLATSREVDTAAASFTTIPMSALEPFQMWQAGNVTLNNGSDIDDTIASINSFDCKWSNGVEVLHGGNTGRNGYCAVEGEAASRYDMKVKITPVDNSLYKYAIAEEALIDVVIPIARTPATGWTQATITEGILISLNDCMIDTQMPVAEAKNVQQEVTLYPTSTSVEIRRAS